MTDKIELFARAAALGVRIPIVEDDPRALDKLHHAIWEREAELMELRHDVATKLAGLPR